MVGGTRTIFTSKKVIFRLPRGGYKSIFLLQEKHAAVIMGMPPVIATESIYFTVVWLRRFVQTIGTVHPKNIRRS
jgi:hypothetical protein